MNVKNTTNNNSSRIDNSNDKQIIIQEALPNANIQRQKLKTSTESKGKGKVIRRGSPSKQSKDKPKRALSAYNIFFKHTRSRIVVGLSEQGTKEETIEAMEEIIANSTIRKPPNSRRYRNPHNTISFADLARQIAEAWKTIDPDRKKIFEHGASVDSKRYSLGIKKWKEKKRCKSPAAFSNRSSLDDISQSSSFQSKTSDGSFESSTSLEETELEHVLITGNFKTIQQEPIHLLTEEELNQKLPGSGSRINFGNQGLQLNDRSSLKRNITTSSSGGKKSESVPLGSQNNVTTFDDMSYQEMLVKNQQLDESINFLQRGISTTNMLEEGEIFFEEDDHVQKQQHQQAPNNGRGLSRAFSGGFSIDRVQQLYRRRELMNNSPLSFSIENNNDINNSVDGLYDVGNYLENSMHHHQSFSNYQYNDYMVPLNVKERGLETPPTFALNQSSIPTNLSLLTDCEPDMVPDITTLMIGKETVMPQIDDSMICNNHVDDGTEPIPFDVGLKSPLIDNISPPTSIRRRKENDTSLHTHQIDDEDIRRLEMAIGDNQLGKQSIENQQFHNEQEDFWNEGCKNLK